MKHVAERLRSSSLLFALSAIFLISGCRSREQVQGPGGSGRPPAPVIVASVDLRDIPVQISAIGSVEAYQTVQIRSQVNGQIQKIFFKEGEDVRQGQPLFQLDKRPFQADLEKAIGQMKHDQAQAENSRMQAERYSGLASNAHLKVADFTADGEHAYVSAKRILDIWRKVGYDGHIVLEVYGKGDDPAGVSAKGLALLRKYM